MLLVAACSLTVSAIAGLMERRRPFALLRASGVRLRRTPVDRAAGDRRSAGGHGDRRDGSPCMLIALPGGPDAVVAWPSPGFFVGLAGAVMTALAVCLITWPLMDVVTRHDNVRFE